MRCKNAFKVSRYYHTEWVPEGSLQFSIDGLDLDAVYASLVRQVAGDELSFVSGETLQEAVSRNEARKQLQKRIALLEAKIRKEKQLNRKMEINSELKNARKELDGIS